MESPHRPLCRYTGEPCGKCSSAIRVDGPHRRILSQAADAYDRAARAPYGRVPAPTSAGDSLRRAARLLSAYGYLASDPSFRPIVLVTRLAALAEAIVALRQNQERAAQAAGALNAAERLHAAEKFYAGTAAGDRIRSQTAAALAGAGFPASPHPIPAGIPVPAPAARGGGAPVRPGTAGTSWGPCRRTPCHGSPGQARCRGTGRDAYDRGLRQAGPGSEPDGQVGQRGHQIVRQLQARALAERGYPLSPDELATTLGATTILPSDVIARLARADGEDHVPAAAGRGRADDLNSAFAAPLLSDGVLRSEHVTAASKDKLIANTASARASGDRAAAQLAAESFPCTATDAVPLARKRNRTRLPSH
jgi:hypothetical protein